MKLILTLILCVSSIAYQASTLAADGDVTTTETTQAINAEKLLCPDADFWGKKMLTDVCWSCLFPIRLLGLTIFDVLMIATIYRRASLNNHFVPVMVTKGYQCSW